jgi:hypothetical protein
MYSDLTVDQLEVGSDIAVIHQSTFHVTGISHGKVSKILKTRLVVTLEANDTYKERDIRFVTRDGNVTGEEGRTSHYTTLTMRGSERYTSARNTLIENSLKNKIRTLADKIMRTHDLAALDPILTELTEAHEWLGTHLAKKGN